MIKLQIPSRDISILTGFGNFFIEELKKIDNNLLSTDEFKLFYYIKENILSDIQYFSNVYLDFDSMGFIPVKRNIRISSEALLDLYNLINVTGYKNVLAYMDNKKDNQLPNEFEKIRYQGNITIISKFELAKKYGFDQSLDFLMKNNYINEMNKYIHASIFIQPNIGDNEVKLQTAKRLLSSDLIIYKKSVELLCDNYKNNFDFRNCFTIDKSMPWKKVSFEEVYIKCKQLIDNMACCEIQSFQNYSLMN